MGCEVPGVVDLVVAGSQAHLVLGAIEMVVIGIVKYSVRTVQLGSLAGSDVAQLAQDVERRFASANGFGGMKGLVVQAVLHAHPVAFFQRQTFQIHFVMDITVSFQGSEPFNGRLAGDDFSDTESHVGLVAGSKDKGFFPH